MPRPRLLIAALACGFLVVPAAASARDGVYFYPALSAKPKLPAVKATSGLRVLLPAFMHLDDLTDGPRKYRLRADATAGSYELTLVNSRCAPADPCRRIAIFSAERTSDAPAGNLALPKGRKGSFTAGSCTGGGCTPPSITWIERGARYTVYAYVGRHKLAGFVRQAIRGGAR
ncbi:MAG: hypothetical protein JWM73_2131 [Solirubrobacterales bacterium]|nr:hypothetical protein [Solirubrobacterales bacterium]